MILQTAAKAATVMAKPPKEKTLVAIPLPGNHSASLKTGFSSSGSRERAFTLAGYNIHGDRKVRPGLVAAVVAEPPEPVAPFGDVQLLPKHVRVARAFSPLPRGTDQVLPRLEQQIPGPLHSGWPIQMPKSCPIQLPAKSCPIFPSPDVRAGNRGRGQV